MSSEGKVVKVDLWIYAAGMRHFESLALAELGPVVPAQPAVQIIL